MDPGRRGPPPVEAAHPPSLEAAGRAVETVKALLPHLTVPVVVERREPRGYCYDAVLSYHGYAVDRVHVNPFTLQPLPKGLHICNFEPIDVGEARGRITAALREFWVVAAAEYREPERAWVVPLAWRHYIVAHVKVSSDGGSVIPDMPLTAEVQRVLERM